MRGENGTKNEIKKGKVKLKMKSEKEKEKMELKMKSEKEKGKMKLKMKSGAGKFTFSEKVSPAVATRSQQMW